MEIALLHRLTGGFDMHTEEPHCVLVRKYPPTANGIVSRDDRAMTTSKEGIYISYLMSALDFHCSVQTCQ
jgi:hypothetical protein